MSIWAAATHIDALHTDERGLKTIQNILVFGSVDVHREYLRQSQYTSRLNVCVCVRAFASVIWPIVRIFMFIQNFAVFVSNQSRNA